MEDKVKKQKIINNFYHDSSYYNVVKDLHP